MNAYWLRAENEAGILFQVTARGEIEFGPAYTPENAMAALLDIYRMMDRTGATGEPDQSILFYANSSKLKSRQGGNTDGSI